MAEHLIRLRGGWLRESPAGADPDRLALPAAWGPADGPAVRLSRRFHPPRLGPGESARLRMAAMPGLVAASLDGRPIPLPPDPNAEWSVPLDAPAGGARLLVLDVDLARLDPRQAGRPWGEAALAIGPADSPLEDRPPDAYNGPADARTRLPSPHP